MEITWQGHSCFQLRMSSAELSDTAVLLTDPFEESLGLRMNPRPGTSFTIATVSNPHPNHSAIKDLPGNPRIFRAPGEYEFRGISVRGTMTGIPLNSPWEERNIAYGIHMEGITICHLGDISRPLTTAQLEELQPLDVLLVPTGGHCTLDLPDAAQVIQDLLPKVVIPMHHRTPGVQVELAPLEDFLQLLGGGEVQAQSRLNITETTLPQDRRLVLLIPQARPTGPQAWEQPPDEDQPEDQPESPGDGA